jgi:hypothetical protein
MSPVARLSVHPRASVLGTGTTRVWSCDTVAHRDLLLERVVKVAAFASFSGSVEPSGPGLDCFDRHQFLETGEVGRIPRV